MSRSGENIYKRKDGRYEARYISGRDSAGKAILKSVYGRSKAEVREKVEIAKREICGVPSPLEGKTFQQVAEEYLADVKGKIASTTYDRYLDALERNIYPEYADTHMSDVTDAEVNRFLQVAPDMAAKRGRTLTRSGLMVLKAVMRNVINYANAVAGMEGADLSGNKVWDKARDKDKDKDKTKAKSADKVSYEELTPQELEMLCFKAKHDHSPEMLAALLSVYCGMRTGELCALKSEDVDGVRNEIYIHEIAHRVRNPKKDEPDQKKTIIIVEEISRKKQIRRVRYPAVLRKYIDECRQVGKPLIRNKDDELLDPRTLENWLNRVMGDSRMEGINFERLRKTYMNGLADEQILHNVFVGTKPAAPYGGSIDVEWLMEELSKDLAPLRMLVGLSLEEAADMLGVSTNYYRQLENGSREASWDQYLSILFFYHYNARTTDIVDNLGLYPDSLRAKMKIDVE